MKFRYDQTDIFTIPDNLQNSKQNLRAIPAVGTLSASADMAPVFYSL